MKKVVLNITEQIAVQKVIEGRMTSEPIEGTRFRLITAGPLDVEIAGDCQEIRAGIAAGHVKHVRRGLGLLNKHEAMGRGLIERPTKPALSPIGSRARITALSNKIEAIHEGFEARIAAMQERYEARIAALEAQIAAINRERLSSLTVKQGQTGPVKVSEGFAGLPLGGHG